jgi:hypothetical protein
MKFQSEIFYIGLIAIATSISISFLIYYSSIFSAKIKGKISSNILEQNTLTSLSNFYILRLPVFGKTYLQIAIDSMLNLRKFKGKDEYGKSVFYGKGLGMLNASQIVYEYFDQYFGKKWKITLILNNLNVSYGYEIKTKYSYILPIPIPDDEVGYIKLEISE